MPTAYRRQADLQPRAPQWLPVPAYRLPRPEIGETDAAGIGSRDRSCGHDGRGRPRQRRNGVRRGGPEHTGHCGTADRADHHGPAKSAWAHDDGRARVGQSQLPGAADRARAQRRRPADTPPPPTGPITLNPGQTGTITVTITPSGDSGTVVRGTLYIDDFDFFTDGGDELVALPYTYTIK
jgi:hypothetical protein